MREKKYANILDDVDDNIVDDLKEEIQELDEIEEKLSLTRELKFKELQDGIDNDIKQEKLLKEEASNNKQKIDNEVVDDEPIIREVDLSLSKKEMKKQLKEEKKAQKKAQEDLYLTSSFKPLRNRFRLKKAFKVIFVLAFILGLGAAAFYFLIFPIYHMYLASKPRAIFEHSVDYVAQQLTTIVNDNYLDESNYKFVDMNFMIDSNANDELGFFGNYFGLRMGFDQNDSETVIYTKDPVTNEEFSYSNVFIDDKEYALFSHTENILFSSSESLDFELEESESVIDKKDLLYLIDKEKTVIKELLNDKYISSQKDEVEINGKTLSVIRNSFSLDSISYNEVMKKYTELLSKDDKYISILANTFGVDKDDVIDEFLTYEEVTDEEYSLIFNIYTVKGNKVVGFDIEENGFRILYLYFNDNNFDFHLNLSDDECSEGKDCAIENSMVIDLIGEKKDSYTEVEIKYNYVEVAVLKVREISFEKIDFDFEIDYSDLELDGSFLFDIDMQAMDYKLILDVNIEEENFVFEINANYDTEFKISEIDESKVIPYTDKKLEKEMVEFYSVLDEKGQLESFDFWFNVCVSILNGEELSMEDFEITM